MTNDYDASAVPGSRGHKQGTELHRLLTQLQRLPVAIAVLDPDLRYVAVSQRWAFDFGLEQGAVGGRSHFDFFSDDDGTWRGRLERGVAGEVGRGKDAVMVRREGATYRVRWEVRPWSQAEASAGGCILFVEDETERWRAEAALRQERQFLWAVLENLQAGLVACNAEGVLTLFNRATREFHGLPEHPIPPEQWAAYYDLYLPDGKTPMQKEEIPLYQAWKGKHVRDAEMMIMPKDEGPARTVLASGRSFYDEEGAKLGAVVLMHDVTDLKRAEQALRERERQLLRAQRLAHIGSWEWDLRSGVLTWSDELYRIYALEEGTALTMGDFIAHIHPDDRARVQAAIDEAVRTGKPFSIQHRIVRADGTERILRGEGEGWTDEAGNAHKVMGTGRDVTEAVRGEDDLRASEERFRLLAENMNDLVSLHDAEGRFLYLSPSVERILGYRPEVLVGKRLVDLVHEDDVERVREEMEMHRSEGSAFWLTVMRVCTAEGAYLWLEATLTFVRDEAGDVLQLQSSARDVTERLRAERELDRSHDVLRQRNRELQDFTHVASHDLQEPLRKIRAFADLMLEDYGSVVDENGRYYLQRMQEAAARMARLISDLLAFSRIATKAQPFEQVDLNQIAADVVSDLEILIDDVKGHVEVDPLPVLEADPTQMRQLLQNLIGNALKFHEEGVEPVVRVAATLQEGAGKTLDEPVCVLQVSDNGIGFDEKYLDRIFTPFKRLHGRNTFAGTGMGLAICRRIVERHRGTITAHSAPGEGATFVVVLPVRQEQEEAREDAR